MRDLSGSNVKIIDGQFTGEEGYVSDKMCKPKSTEPYKYKVTFTSCLGSYWFLPNYLAVI